MSNRTVLHGIGVPECTNALIGMLPSRCTCIHSICSVMQTCVAQHIMYIGVSCQWCNFPFTYEGYEYLSCTSNKNQAFVNGGF